MGSSTRLNLITFIMYMLFLFVFLTLASVNYFEPIYKHIYHFLKDMVNIKLIPFETYFILFYALSIFFFFILTIIFLPIDLIHSFLKKRISFFNTIFNIQFILFLIAFGIISIVYIFILNNLGYISIIYLIDAYLITMYISLYILILIIIFNKMVMFLSIIEADFHVTKSNFKEIKTGVNNYKERDVIKRKDLMKFLLCLFVPLLLIIFAFIIEGILAWYAIIFLIFNSFIIFKILKNLNNKEFFYYDDLYKILDNYFDKRFVILFGILAIIAVVDTINKFLLNNYTVQFILQPMIPMIERNPPSYYSWISIFHIGYFFLYYFLYLFDFKFTKNIDKVKKEIKEIQVNPIFVFLSYFVLFIVFLINLIL